MSMAWVPLSYAPFGVKKGVCIFKFYLLKMKIIFNTSFKGQVQCQNARIKLFNSSLIKISMLMSEHLVYQKIVTSRSMLS